MVESNVFPKDLCNLLCDVGFSEAKIPQFFALTENDKEWILVVRRAMGVRGVEAMQKLVKQTGGAYQPRPATYFIPRGQRVEVPSDTPTKLRSHETSETEPQPAQTITVKLNQLIYGKYSPRYKVAKGLRKPKVNEEHVDRLVDALKAGEKLPMPKVRPFERNNVAKVPLYEVVDGEHTCMACEKFGLDEIEVVPKGLSHLDALLFALDWNLRHGLPVTPLQEARQIERMLNECEGVSQEQIAKRLNRSPAWVSNRRALLKVADKEKFTRVNLGHARKIVTAKEEDREPIAEKVDREGLSVKDTIAVVEAIEEIPEKKHEILTSMGRPTVYSCGIPGCKEGTYNPERYDGVRLCISHRKLFNEDPGAIEKLLKQKASSPQKIETKIFKPKEKWEHRKATMQVGVSKFENHVGVKLQRRGLPMGQPNKEVTVPFHKPDRIWYLPKGCLVAYFDGPVHKGREDRDRAVREAWRTLGVRVVEVKFERDSDEATDETVDELERNFREMGWVPLVPVEVH
ncbi:MAG: ParB/RepB/Spo0J family partition protein [Desulfobacterales bacterium]|nr:ParB/RepB/Spo0J family partition protein [Desulfobacterales bacterium]